MDQRRRDFLRICALGTATTAFTAALHPAIL